MNILYFTYGELSLEGGVFRPVAMLRALAEAGHRVFIIAAKTTLPEHPNIRILEGKTGGPKSRHKLRMAIIKATGMVKIDAIHAVDYAAPFSMQVAGFRRIPIIYDASRCFSGKAGQPPTTRWKVLPSLFAGEERTLLRKARAVLVPSSALASDLQAIRQDARIVQVEDVPAQTLQPCREEINRATLFSRFEDKTTAIVVCVVESASHSELRKVLMAARKVIDAVPGISFFFKGADLKDSRRMAANLDISGRCAFFGEHEADDYLCALEIAEAVFLLPRPESRYPDPAAITLLNAPAPLVAVLEPASSGLLTETNCMAVSRTTDSMAEGLLRVIREPLFSVGLVAEGQQRIADQYSLASFKHKVRMVYHDAVNKK